VEFGNCDVTPQLSKQIYSRAMGVLKASAAGLQQHAAACATAAGELETTAPPVSGLSGQATAVAVQALHADVGAAAAALVARMEATAAKVAEAARSYEQHEVGAADELRL